MLTTVGVVIGLVSKYSNETLAKAVDESWG